MDLHTLLPQTLRDRNATLFPASVTDGGAQPFEWSHAAIARSA
jgi:hypothetical protein